MFNINDLTPYDPNNPKVNTYFTKRCHNVCFLAIKDDKVYVNDFTFTDEDKDPFNIYSGIFDDEVIIARDIGAAFELARTIYDCVGENKDSSQIINNLEGA